MRAPIRRFDRYLPDKLIGRLQAEPLFKEQLRPDIARSACEMRAGARRVFPAIREDRVDFYYRGGKLFSYDDTGFRTNLKYTASFANVHELRPEIHESDLVKLVPIRDFRSGYGSIKSLCALYAGDEARGMAELYGRHSFAIGKARFVVLDLEASFDARTRDDATEDVQDRIDVVLFDTETRTLMFVEAKRYVNPAIRAAETSVPPVVTQVLRYKDQLAAQRENVLGAYGRYVLGMNKLFGLSLPEPVSIVSDVPLLIFGYDGVQEGSVTKCKRELTRHGLRCLSIGKLPPNDAATLAAWFARAVTVS